MAATSTSLSTAPINAHNLRPSTYTQLNLSFLSISRRRTTHSCIISSNVAKYTEVVRDEEIGKIKRLQNGPDIRALPLKVRRSERWICHRRQSKQLQKALDFPPLPSGGGKAFLTEGASGLVRKILRVKVRNIDGTKELGEVNGVEWVRNGSEGGISVEASGSSDADEAAIDDKKPFSYELISQVVRLEYFKDCLALLNEIITFQFVASEFTDGFYQPADVRDRTYGEASAGHHNALGHGERENYSRANERVLKASREKSKFFADDLAGRKDFSNKEGDQRGSARREMEAFNKLQKETIDTLQKETIDRLKSRIERVEKELQDRKMLSDMVPEGVADEKMRLAEATDGLNEAKLKVRMLEPDWKL
ncbi:hypothetical protein NE237_009546 [Protea cynaroides]|uniref:Uncharacterized protein n=1 Tax=Protea cynaroides TaxID=273540 RepID=A0A9Q0KYJ6_9MAGN|nr:hypothetical protein NE237_009546 [Protea cynaroides]